MRKLHVLLILTILGILDVGVFTIYIPRNQSIQLPLDIDYIENGPYTGNYLVTDTLGPVRIVTLDLELLWESTLPSGFTHEASMLPNGNILVADTGNERAIELNINDPTEILWEWDPRDSNDINWTEFGISNGWGEDALAYVQDMYPANNDWTRMNDAEFINGTKYGRTYDTILISLRNMDLIIEVNYTETKEIVWHYGEPTVRDILGHQHNPDRLDNGNTIIRDSDNHRMIEINTTTNEIVWEFSLEFPNGELRWARDCDDLGDGTYLITDSNNGRVFILDKESKQIIREYGVGVLVQPYEADLVEINGETKILVGTTDLSAIVLIDPQTGFCIVSGIAWLLNFLQVLAVLVAIYYAWRVFDSVKSAENVTLSKQLTKIESYREIFHLTFSIMLLFLIPAIYRFIWWLGFYHTMELVTGLLW